MKWLPLIAICVVLSLIVRPGGILAQTPVAAPTINSVTPGDGRLTIGWSAPAGVTGITAYDLRYIETSADETVDSNWTKVEDVWTGSGDLEYGLGGLDNGVGYDVQMRTVTTTDGAWSGTSTGTPQIPGPAITSVFTGDGALTVVWTAPAVAATTAINAYDLRHIETSEDETMDANWTVVENFWTSGSLHGVLPGLANGTGFDVQLRAASDTDGAWSSTSTGTPAEHGNAIGAATTLTLGTPLGGAIDPGTDEDYFKLVLRSATTILIRTSGDLDTVGELLDSGGSELDMNDDGDLPESPANFLIWRAARAGTYYVKVSSSEEATGEYILDVRAIGDTSSRSNAISVDPDSSTLALVDELNDTDFYRLALLEDSDILVRTSGAIPVTVLELVDNNGGSIVHTDYGYLPPIDRHAVVRSNLAAGTYFIKVTGPRHGEPGPYTLHVNTIAEPGGTMADATHLSLHRAEGGRIDPASDADYFRIVADEEMSILVRGVSQTVDIDGSLLNSSGNPIQANFYDESFYGVHGFTVRATLEAGTYFIKVTRFGGADTGPYSILMINDLQLEDLLNKCSGLNATFSDPLFGCQWHLKNTGQLGGTSGEDINVADVWSGGNTGAGIYVVVVDQQLDFQHDDLTPDETRSQLYVGVPLPSAASHGTKVAGIIAARDNDVGGRGVAPDATVIGHSSLILAEAPGTRVVDEADAMTRNIDVAAVSNNSWSGVSGPELAMAPQHWEAALKTGVTEGYGGKGVLYVFAAGNDADLEGNANLDEFRNHFHVTTVCATNNLGQRSVYSNLGANLWVCAPSGDRTEDHPGIVTTENYSTYVDDFSGTSAAAPMVSGVAALVRAANTSLTWRDVKLILAASARKNDASNTGWAQGALEYRSSTENYWFNHEYGFGVVNANSAVTMAKTWVNVPSLASESTAYDNTQLRIPDDKTTVSRTITVGDGVEFVEFVEIEADFLINNFRELEVTLESPSGAVSVISQSNAGPYVTLCDRRSYSCSLNGSFRFGSAKHLGENPEGEWILRIADRISGSTPGTLRSWRLTIYGHRDTPAAPTIDKVAPGNVTLNVAWSAPTNVGKSSISAYDLRYILSATTDKSDSGWTLTEDVWTLSGGGALEHEIDGLLADTQYDVQVRAVNNDGDGQWSAVKSAAASTDKAPFIKSLTPSSGSLSISWSAPTSSDLGTVTSYDLRYIRSDVRNKAAASWSELTSIWTMGTLEYSLGSLSNGVSYDLQIRAVTGSDQQPWSSAYSKIPRTTPSAPNGVNIVDSYSSAPGGHTLHVLWDRPSNGGAPITGYEIRYIKSAAIDKADDNWTVEQINVYPVLEVFITGLENGESYDVQVRAVNDADGGSWSGTTVGTPSTKPDRLTVDSITAGSRSITVEWSAPSSDGGSDISSYDLRYIKTSDLSVTFKPTNVKLAVWTSGDGDLTATITGLEVGTQYSVQVRLEVGTQYSVQVRAINAAGKGPWSSWKAGTTALSADAAELSSLVLTGATLYPSFAARTTSYKASTGYSDTQITITATPRRDDSTVEFLDGSNQSLTDGDGTDGFQVVLSVGENVVRVRVTASDNVTTKTYAVTVSRAGEDRSLTPSPNDTVGAGVLSTAHYTVTFKGQWNIDVTPGGLPGGAHFSPIIGAVHNAGVTFLRSGEAASSGVKSMAETGGTSELQSELNAAISATQPTALSVLSRSGNIGRQNRVTLNDVAVTTDYPRVTLVAMIAPSPDWFVGVSELSLLDASGNWLPSHEVKLYPWDAGTENGDEFSLSNPATSPQGVITSIGGTGKFSTESIATLTFTLRSANSEPTGAPFITGAAEVGEVLTASTSGIDDADGLTNASFAYQWLADDAEIDGATASTYTLVANDAGKAIKVMVSFTDDAGNDEELTSAATGAVAAAAVAKPPLTATVHGVPSSHNGQDAFTFELRFSEAPKPDFSYTTVRDHAFTVTGGSVTYVRRLEAGENVRWEITVTPGSSAAVAIALNATTDCSATGAICTEEGRKLSGGPLLVVTGPNSPATGVPTISGTAQVGETLTAGVTGISDSDGLNSATFAYQWLADDVEIDGATANSYTLTDTEAGKTIKVLVSFTDDAGNDEELTSAATGAVAAAAPPPNTPATGAPSITGTAQVGETLTAGVTGISDGDGLNSATFAYQWLADDVEINGATASTYTLADAEAGKAIKVRVSFTDDAGNDEELTSAATGAVAAAAVVKPPLTATVHGVPSSHNGQDAFTFELRFSEAPKPDFSYTTVRDHAFTVTGDR